MSDQAITKDGMVYLVGAGPGSPELLTVRAYRLISDADVLLHDSLTQEEVINIAPLTAEIHNVGKKPADKGGGRVSQEAINRLMKKKAEEGHSVIRLKGGDPNVFGRGGEESEYLASQGIPFEVVPGVSSVLAGPAVAGIPLTHRELGSSFTVITGHEDPSKENSALDWEGIGRMVKAGGTLIILMGVRRLEQNVNALLEQGISPDLPAGVIERASYPDEFVLTAPLNEFVERVREEDVSPPAVFVIGKVVSLRERVKEELVREQNSFVDHLLDASTEQL
jgi:uroporphyrin-III C-methyltransferase